MTYKKGAAVNLMWTGYWGVLPYEWSAEPPEVVPPKATGGLPPWLTPTTENIEVDEILYTGTADEVGTWVFDAILSDDYGPAFRYRVGTSTITVTPS